MRQKSRTGGKRKATGRPFPKGYKGPGRPKGSPNKISREIRELAQRLFDEAYWADLRLRLKKRRLPPAVEVKLLAYAYGEPKTDPPPPQWSFDPATLGRMTTEELQTALTHAEAVMTILAGRGPAK